MVKKNILHFAELIGRSKRIKRTGWVREQVKYSESVAEHSFRLIVLSTVLAPLLKADQNKLIRMAIIHDLGETETGDVVVERGLMKDLKARINKEKMETEFIEKEFHQFETQKEYGNLFCEMVQRKTKEARIFWQIDKLEMAIQAYEYEKEQNLDLSEFFDNADNNIRTLIEKNN